MPNPAENKTIPAPDQAAETGPKTERLVNESMTGAQASLLLGEKLPEAADASSIRDLMTQTKQERTERNNNASLNERANHWKGKKTEEGKELTIEEQKKAWEKDMDGFLQKYKENGTEEEKRFFKSVGMDLETTDAKQIYQTFIRDQKGDVEYFAEQIAKNNSAEEIEQNKDLIKRIGTIYGSNSAKVAELLAEGFKNTETDEKATAFVQSAKENLAKGGETPGLDIIETRNEHAMQWREKQGETTTKPEPEPTDKEEEKAIKVGETFYLNGKIYSISEIDDQVHLDRTGGDEKVSLSNGYIEEELARPDGEVRHILSGEELSQIKNKLKDPNLSEDKKNELKKKRDQSRLKTDNLDRIRAFSKLFFKDNETANDTFIKHLEVEAAKVRAEGKSAVYVMELSKDKDGNIFPKPIVIERQQTPTSDAPPAPAEPSVQTEPPAEPAKAKVEQPADDKPIQRVSSLTDEPSVAERERAGGKISQPFIDEPDAEERARLMQQSNLRIQQELATTREQREKINQAADRLSETLNKTEPAKEEPTEGKLTGEYRFHEGQAFVSIDPEDGAKHELVVKNIGNHDITIQFGEETETLPLTEFPHLLDEQGYLYEGRKIIDNKWQSEMTIQKIENGTVTVTSPNGDEVTFNQNQFEELFKNKEFAIEESKKEQSDPADKPEADTEEPKTEESEQPKDELIGKDVQFMDYTGKVIGVDGDEVEFEIEDKGKTWNYKRPKGKLKFL